MQPTRVLDLEVFKDYFLAAFLDIYTGKTALYSMHEGHPLNCAAVRDILKESRIVTFNGNSYDIPILSLALTGADNAKLKQASDSIIVNNVRNWQLANKYKFKLLSTVDHIDLIEVAPGTASLKIYGGRLHCPKMQDLPFDPSASIEPDQRRLVNEYCANDLGVTALLYQRLLPQIELREQMGELYDMDLRSKSDAQIAEAVIASGVSKITGRPTYRPEIATGTEYRYKAPAFLEFTRSDLRELLYRIQVDPFVVQDSGKPLEPKWLKDLKITIGAGVYRMGIGGLHSTEHTVAHKADADHILVDRDVASYYPSIILNEGLHPKQMGAAFNRVYRKVYDERLAAKHSGDKVGSDSLKIVLNSSFGKFGSKWSVLYSPDLLLRTTLTGQLALLMLIEQLELRGIPVVSANTDGIVIRCHKGEVSVMHSVVEKWERVSGFVTEETKYAALYCRDVNNYIALKEDGGHKLKGVFAVSDVQKNPTNTICVDAVLAYLKRGTPIEQTIYGCFDVRRFLSIRSVKGGALDQRGEYLGKAVRWYNTTAHDGPLTYKINGYTVPKTEGAQAAMELPATLPLDIDYEHYINETRSILSGIGATHA